MACSHRWQDSFVSSRPSFDEFCEQAIIHLWQSSRQAGRPATVQHSPSSDDRAVQWEAIGAPSGGRSRFINGPILTYLWIHTTSCVNVGGSQRPQSGSTVDIVIMMMMIMTNSPQGGTRTFSMTFQADVAYSPWPGLAAAKYHISDNITVYNITRLSISVFFRSFVHC